MKRSHLIVTLVCFLAAVFFAQYATAQDTVVVVQSAPPPPPPQSQSHIRLNLYANYAFDDHVEAYASNTSFYSGTIKGGLLWGAGLQFDLRQNYGLELIYMRQDTKADMDYYYQGNQKSDIDVSANYVMIGGVKSMRRPGSKAEPFGGFMLGANFISAKNPNPQINSGTASATKFAWGLRGGANIWASERVGLKLQAMLLSSVQGVGGSLYFGTGGAGAGVSTYSTVLQFVLGGGLTFKLGGS